MKKITTAVALSLTLGIGAINAENKDFSNPTVTKAETEVLSLKDKVYPAFVLIGGGSGVCISEDGYFITNHHVWNDAAAPAKTVVKLAGNNFEYTADAVGADPRGDIVLGKLRIEEGHKVPFVNLGDSDKVQVGDICLSVGNPFLLSGAGSEPTVTIGTVTANHRFQGGYNDSIQIDTAINPGNSGGPSFNLDGEVIGINGRNIASHGKRFNTGAGYAIPSNQIKNFMSALKAQEGGALVVRHGIVEGLTFDLGFQDGAKIKGVAANTHGSDAGFKAGDIIRKMDHYDVFNSYRYYGIVGTKPRGSSFQFTVERDGEMVDLTATNNMPTEAGQFGTVPRTADEERNGGGGGIFGAMDPFKLPPMKSSLGFKGSYNEDRAVGGYVVTRIKNNSALGEAGMEEGDILTHVNGRHIAFFADMHDILIAIEPGTEITVTYVRDGEEFETTAVTKKK